MPLHAADAMSQLLSGAAHLVARTQKDSHSERPVGPGAVHIQEHLTSGPLNFNVLRVDLTNPHIHVITEKAKDKLFTGERVQDTAASEDLPGHAVVGAVNGDFWVSPAGRLYQPVGPFVSDGMIYSTNGRPKARSVFGVTRSGRVFIDRISMVVEIATQGTRSPLQLQIERINDVPTTNGWSIYTQVYGKPLPDGHDVSYQVLTLDKSEFLPNQTVTARAGAEVKPGSTIATGTLVLARDARSQKLATPKRNSRLKILARVPEVDDVITYCIGGAPRILRDGRVSVETEVEKTGAAFASDRHPRTAVGVSADRKTLFLVTVDGRQPLISIGETLDELAHYMLKLGCADAMNMDGGGSTTMVVRGDVVNRTSDLKGSRKVSNSLLVISDAQPGPLVRLQVEPSGEPLRIPAGAGAIFSVRGVDDSYNPVALDPNQLTWSVDSAAGKIAKHGIAPEFQAAAVPANAKVSVSAANGVSQAVPVSVETASAIEVSPETLLLTSGENSEIEINASGQSGALLIQPEFAQLHASDDSVSSSKFTVHGIHDGEGKLEIRVGTTAAAIPYYVDRFKTEMVAAFDDLGASHTLAGSNFDHKASVVATDAQLKKEGAASLDWKYAMSKSGGTSKITLPLNAAAPGEPAKFSLWIYGDGKEAWVRAEVEDVLKHRFLLDFTEGSKGVYWKDEWRHVFVPVKSLTPRPANPGATPEPPFVVREIYLAQDQEALKATGELHLDRLEAIYPPNK